MVASPRVVISSSLIGSSLNRHIIEEVTAGFAELGSVTLLSPDRLLLSDGLRHADLFVYVGSTITETVPLSTLAAYARDSGVASVAWATDDPYEYDTRIRADGFDVYFSNDRNAARSYLERPNVFHLPLAGGPSDIRDVRPWDERALDIFFAGTPYKNRRRFVEDLADDADSNRNAVLVMGTGWEQVPGVQSLTLELDHSRLVDVYSQSRFVLNLGRDEDLGNSYRKLVAVTPGPRTFEAALAGTPQFYVRQSFDIDEYFDPGSEIIIIDDVAEVWERWRWYAAHPESWRTLALAAQARAVRDHLYEHRVNTMLRVLRQLDAL